ncbi:MAG: DNA-binding response regulator [Acidobacteria bacterium]|nr:DNA-binding response regulator [Acidobacteriota bacterium]|tara:strand:+ start:3013 stop:3696 length:684 start_codon:yes stop_codon:yes gene_type:complete
MKAKVLVVEDDHDIAELVRLHLVRAGFETELVTSGDEVLPRLREARPDLVVLDVMLPGLSGLEVCRLVRADAELAAVPIVMVTARVHEEDRVAGFEIGADDYVTKPFSPRELVARVQAVLRRTKPLAADQVVNIGSISIDLASHEVACEGQEVRLTAKEFLLLRYFIEHQGRVLSRDRLLSDVWGYRYTGGTRTVDVHVRRLREKLPVLVQQIVTIKQFGYKFIDTR